jgi:hypothetical protein
VRTDVDFTNCHIVIVIEILRRCDEKKPLDTDHPILESHSGQECSHWSAKTLYIHQTSIAFMIYRRNQSN